MLKNCSKFFLRCAGDMGIDAVDYELISETDYENLPDDDERCFVEFEKICRKNMREFLRHNKNAETEQELLLQYMSSVSAVADECNIPNINFSLSIERSLEEEFGEFDLAVKAEIARIKIRKRGEHRTDSVLLEINTKSKIEHYILRIRELVDISDLADSRKRKIFEKLDILRNELSRPRFRFSAAMASLTTIVAFVAGATTIAAEGQNAISQIMSLIGEQKESEEAAQKRLAPPLKALPAPKATQSHRRIEPLDDEMPF